MIISGRADFMEVKTGLKKDGSQWFMFKFHDIEGENYFRLFADERLFKKAKDWAKGSQAALQIDLFIGEKNSRANLVDVDLLP